MDDIPAGRLVIAKFHGQVSGLLFHPVSIGVRRTAGYMNAAGAKMNEEQHIKGDQPSCCPDFFGKKVSCPVFFNSPAMRV
jgi:hypothetical protein